MTDDPIIAEVRRHRQEHAARFNYDLDAIVADFQRIQIAHADRLVTRPKRAPRRRPAATE